GATGCSWVVYTRFKETQDVAQARADARGRGVELFDRQTEAVDPQRRVAEPGGADRVPAVARDEQDVARRQVQRLRAERVGGGGGLYLSQRVHAGPVGEQPRQAGT